MTISYLNIPNYPDPTAAGSPITAVGVIGSIQADFANGQGSIGLVIYRSLAALQAGSEPLERVQVRAGSPARTRATKGQATGPAFPAMAAIQAAKGADWADLWTYFLTQLVSQAAFPGSSVQTG